jgi:Amt family ammonium transporter
VWADNGWLFKMGVLDFAGGTVVHISSGLSALVLALLVGKRLDYGRAGGSPTLPYNLALTLTGAGLLWFGWFGFNAGSAIAADKPVAGSQAALAFTTTQAAAAAAALLWMIIEWRHHGKPTSLGVASGIVAGLVAVTPAAGHVHVASAIAIGVAASAICYTAVQLKSRLGYDDTLDAFGVHGVGGTFGALVTGVFCFTPVKGLIFGDSAQLGKQAIGVLSGAALAGAGTLLIGGTLKATLGLRVHEQQERDGLDISVHGERVAHSDLM